MRCPYVWRVFKEQAKGRNIVVPIDLDQDCSFVSTACWYSVPGNYIRSGVGRVQNATPYQEDNIMGAVARLPIS